MDRTGLKVDINLVIKQESLEPIVKKYFDQISAAQWSMLAAGNRDSDTEQGLAAMFLEIVRSVSAAVLRTVIPLVLKRARGPDGDTAVDNFNIQLGNSLAASFAASLEVPLDNFASTVKLSELVEKEISQKVCFLVNMATGTSVWPREPAIFVSSFMSNPQSLHKMVVYTSKCLRRYLGKLSSKRLALDWHLADELPDPLVTQAVSGILEKWSPEAATTEKMFLGSSLDVQCAASRMIRTIIDGSHHLQNADVSGFCEKPPSSPLFVTSLLVKQVKDFYSSQSKSSGDTALSNPQVLKEHFITFAEKQRKRTLAEVKAACQGKDLDFIVSFERGLGSSSRLKNRGLLDVGILPEASSASNTAPAAKLSVNRLVKCIVSRCFKRLNLQRNPAADKDSTLSDFSEDIWKFLTKLSLNILAYMIGSQRYRCPFDQMGSLSNFVKPDPRKRVDAAKSLLSSKVVHLVIEDALGRYLQQILLWIDKTRETRHSEEVSGAVNDIVSHVTQFLNQTKANNGTESTTLDTGPDLQGSRTATTLPSSATVSPQVLTGPPSVCVQKLRSGPKRVSLPQLGKTKAGDKKTSGSYKCLQESIPQMSDDTVCPIKEIMINKLVILLLKGIISKVPEQSKKRAADFGTVVKHLSDRLLEEIDIPDTAIRKIWVKINTLKKIVVEDLETEFFSAQRTLEIAMKSDQSTFNDAVVFYLKCHLRVLIGPAKRKHALSRFFSSLRKTFVRQFRCCNKPKLDTG